MKTKITPGPWTLELNGFLHDCDVIRGANGLYVAGTRTVRNDDGSPNPMHNRADSVLIAAAPCLLAALEDCVKAMERMEHSDHYWIVSDEVEQARAAIAKAKGLQ